MICQKVVLFAGVLSPHPLVPRGLLPVTTCVPKTHQRLSTLPAIYTCSAGECLNVIARCIKWYQVASAVAIKLGSWSLVRESHWSEFSSRKGHSSCVHYGLDAERSERACPVFQSTLN